MLFSNGVLEVWRVNSSNKAIRIVANHLHNSHTTPIFKKLGILKITDLYQVYLYKLHYRNIIIYCPHTFEPSPSSSPCMETTTIICGIHILDFQ